MAAKEVVHRRVWATSRVTALPGSKQLITVMSTRSTRRYLTKIKEAKKPKRDLELETLAGVLDGDIIIHMHCYRADEMMTILDLAKEFNYKVGTFHHGVEAYKISSELAENGFAVRSGPIGGASRWRLTTVSRKTLRS